ncbi:hypothetical protein Ccrd_011208, partial [Cynara cardunculus var. scolymus]
MNSKSNLKVSTGKQSRIVCSRSPEKPPAEPERTPEIKSQDSQQTNSSESVTDTKRSPNESQKMGSIEEMKPLPIGGFKDWSESGKPVEKTDFVESGKSSICRGSTSTDLSDESSYSSLTGLHRTTFLYPTIMCGSHILFLAKILLES